MRSSQTTDLTQDDPLRLLPKRGLETSSWAPNGSRLAHTPSYTSSNWGESRPGDWTCPTCGFSNFQWRDACMRCSKSAKTNGMRKDIVGSERDEGPYICKRIHPNLGEPCRTKFARLYDLQRHQDLIHGGWSQADDTTGGKDGVECKSTQLHTRPRLPEASDPIAENRHGLSTSRWAPRNYAGRPRRANVNEVWIKVFFQDPLTYHYCTDHHARLFQLQTPSQTRIKAIRV